MKDEVLLAPLRLHLHYEGFRDQMRIDGFGRATVQTGQRRVLRRRHEWRQDYRPPWVLTPPGYRPFIRLPSQRAATPLGAKRGIIQFWIIVFERNDRWLKS